MLSWENLRDQFGQEYATPKDFKREFRDMLQSGHAPSTRMPGSKGLPGGFILRPSPPPITKTMRQRPRDPLKINQLWISQWKKKVIHAESPPPVR